MVSKAGGGQCSDRTRGGQLVRNAGLWCRPAVYFGELNAIENKPQAMTRETHKLRHLGTGNCIVNEPWPPSTACPQVPAPWDDVMHVPCFETDWAWRRWDFSERVPPAVNGHRQLLLRLVRTGKRLNWRLATCSTHMVATFQQGQGGVKHRGEEVGRSREARATAAIVRHRHFAGRRDIEAVQMVLRAGSGNLNRAISGVSA